MYFSVVHWYSVHPALNSKCYLIITEFSSAPLGLNADPGGVFIESNKCKRKSKKQLYITPSQVEFTWVCNMVRNSSITHITPLHCTCMSFNTHTFYVATLMGHIWGNYRIVKHNQTTLPTAHFQRTILVHVQGWECQYCQDHATGKL